MSGLCPRQRSNQGSNANYFPAFSMAYAPKKMGLQNQRLASVLSWKSVDKVSQLSLGSSPRRLSTQKASDFDSVGLGKRAWLLPVAERQYGYPVARSVRSPRQTGAQPDSTSFRSWA